MQSIQQFNALNGAQVSREEIERIIALAKLEEQTEVYNRLQPILNYNSDDKFIFEIENQAIEVVPKSLLHCLDCEDFEDNNGLSKPVSPGEVYDLITRKMIEMIKNANEKYKKKWNAKEYGTGYTIPFNFISKKRYRGVNVLMLTELEPLENPFFLTFKQVKDLKGKVKKGAKGHEVIYFTKIWKTEDKTKDLKFSSYDKSKVETFATENGIDNDLGVIPMLKYYNVYNGKDIEGIDFKLNQFKTGFIDLEKPSDEKNRMPIPEAIIKNYPSPQPVLKHGGNEAYHRGGGNGLIQMPYLSDFDTVQDYYRTLFHEYSHSTGSPERLNRQLGNKFGTKPYAFEELIAELGATFLSAEAGIIWHNNNNHAAYLKSWNRVLTYLQDDNKFIMKASTLAQKVADFILQFDADGNPLYFKDIVQETAQIEVKKPEQVKQKAIKKIIELQRNKGNHTAAGNNQVALFGPKSTIDTEKFKKMTVSELRKFTLDFYNQNLKGKKVAIKNHLKEVVFFAAAGRKILQPIYSEKVAVIEHLESLIKNSSYNNWGKRKTSDAINILGYLNFKSKITIDGIKRHVRISVILDINRKTSLKTFEVGANKKSGDLPKVAVASPKDGDKKPLYENKDNKNNTKKQNSGLIGFQPLATTQVNTNSLAERLKNNANSNREYYKIEDHRISDFLGKIEKKQKESVAITLAGGQGSMKTRFCFQLMNAFAQNYKVGHASIEEHPESALYEDKINQYLNEKATQNISAPEISTIEDIHKLVRENDVIIIDSFSKLQEMQKGCALDKDFRKAYDGKLFIIIYQLTTNGKMRGGSSSQFDGDIVSFIEKKANYQDNYVYFDKNRYQKKNLEDLKFNIFTGNLVQNQNSEETQPKEPIASNQFNFKVI